MYDRQPTPGQEGRVQIIKEDGSSFYARIVMADNPLNAGTPLNKSTLLKDQTAALLGLTAAAVPDDAFAFVGKYNQHWWRRQAVTALYGYSEVQTQADKNGQYVFRQVAGTIKYSSSITINQTTGAISLVNPKSVYVSRDQVKTADQVNSITALLNGKYVTGLSEMNSGGNYPRTSNVFYVPSGTKWDMNYSEDSGYYYAVYPYGNKGYYINLVTTKIFSRPAGDVSYVHSTNRSAYPDSGQSSGYAWQYLGVPLQNAATAPKFVSGTLTTTGQAAEFIGLPFAPKLLILAQTSYNRAQSAPLMVWISPATTACLGTYYGSQVKVSFNGTNVVLELGDGSIWPAGQAYGYIAVG